MKFVFAEYSDLWPEASRRALEPILAHVPCFRYPQDHAEIASARNPAGTIVIFDNGDIPDIMKIVGLGYEHCLQRQRPDFASELLASSLMVTRPESFMKNPLPFFFTGFQAGKTVEEPHITSSFIRAFDKGQILRRLDKFLAQNDRLQGVYDLCMQAADELITNAIFAAPIDSKGKPTNRELARTRDVILPEGHKANFFCSVSSHRVVVGVEDTFGSFHKPHLLSHLENSFLRDQSVPRAANAGGAGLGLHFVVENAANVYIYCEKRRRSLVAAGFLLEGLRANLAAYKHFHVSFGT